MAVVAVVAQVGCTGVAHMAAAPVAEHMLALEWLLQNFEIDSLHLVHNRKQAAADVAVLEVDCSRDLRHTHSYQQVYWLFAAAVDTKN